MNLNYYEILGVSKDASFDDIKIAYKKQMKKWHPDINKSSDAIIMSSKINEAKEILLDEIKRKDYDEYLNKKVDEDYNRYTQNKNNKEDNTNEYNNANNYENTMVTKWQYLADWLKYANVSFFRKLIGLIGVLLESLFCLIIKLLIILIAYISNTVSYMIRYLFNYLSPLFLLILILFIGMCLISGFNNAYNDNKSLFNVIIITGIIYGVSFILPIFSKIILSKKTFYILYNKIDIVLFKKCVSYDK